MNMDNEKTNSLTEQIQNTQTHLETLEAERDDFQKRMMAAVGAGDSDATINLRRRQSEVPIEIEAAQIRLAKMQLESDQQRISVLQAKVAKFAEPIPAAVLKRDAAVLELNLLQDQYRTANEDFRDLNRRIGERSRELGRLIHMANPAREIGGTRLRSLNSH
jgi:chromosome segregation ATPase